MEQLSDDQIFKDLRSENKNTKDSALTYLYTRHYPVIAAYIEKNSGTVEDAADIFQDAIIVFYEKVRFEQLDLNCSIRTYIFSVSKHLWLNKLRSQKKMTSLDNEVQAIKVPAESLSILESSEQEKLIAQLLAKMGEDCRKVLNYYYFERLKMKEIATNMGFANEQVAKNKKSKCMNKLKALVAEFPELKNILRYE